MKRCLVVALLLLFCAASPLFSQSARIIPLYVPPVDGYTGNPDDNAYFTDLLIRELKAWNFEIMETPGEADYALVGMLSWNSVDEEGVTEYSLLLSLLDKYGNVLFEQPLYYTVEEEVNAYLPPMLLSMLSQVFLMYLAEDIEEEPEEEIDPDEWRKREWYFGAGALWTPRIYYGALTSVNLANFGFGLSAEYHFQRFAEGKLEFLKYLSVGVGAELTSDWVIATARPGDEYRNTIMQIIPLRVQYVWRQGELFMHEPYAGIQFNIPLYRDTTPALTSWHTGFQFGLKLGPGIAYGDIRYSMDIGKSGLSADKPNDTRRYDRYMIYLGIGYKYDLVGMIRTLIGNRPQKESETTEEDSENSESNAPAPWETEHFESAPWGGTW